jgi:hypothetical protein
VFPLIALHCALCLTSIMPSNAESYLRADETRWAKRLGLKESYVRQIVKAANFSEDDEVRIENLDVGHLSARKHILLVTAAGNGHCLTLVVIARKAGSLEKIWETADFHDGGFCHVGAYSGNFEARATREGAIVIDVPKFATGKYVFDEIKRLIYKWDGKTYVLSEEVKR